MRVHAGDQLSHEVVQHGLIGPRRDQRRREEIFREESLDHG